MPISLRSFAAVAVSAALLGAGCSNSPTSTGPTHPTPTPTPTPTPAVNAALVSQAYQARFALNVPRPALSQADPRVGFVHGFTSTAYIDSTLYRLYFSRTGAIEAADTLCFRRPAGRLDVLVVVFDHGNSNIASAAGSLLPPAQEAINQQMEGFERRLGYPELLRYNSRHLVLPAASVGDPRDRNAVREAARDEGVDPNGFDIVVSWNVDTTANEGCFAAICGPSDFSYCGYLGVPFTPDGRYIEFDATMVGNVIQSFYIHEFPHLFGWEHEWTTTFATPLADQRTQDGFVTEPALLGWTDTDGDGVPEILDSTPYGR